ncbi:RHD3/Sey1 [Phlyctochytrium arcticum]|nr:RHD3/Sey1 [Phlyctochytrium arcticum]
MASDGSSDFVVPDVDEGEHMNGRWAMLDAADPRLQVVNETQDFTSSLLDYMRDKWRITEQGFDYNVVAVFGSQSTGKSTLLNRLFGTTFDVMDESARQQTTKGIWVSKAEDANLLVLDVEGTDGRERGEDQDFERKSALFSLAIAECLIINMWENQVGLYHGANLGLLKTVFEVNLQLFQQNGAQKTCLFFVIRDFTGRTPVDSLRATLIKSLEETWNGLSKPAGKENSLYSEYFDVQFVALPHKIFAHNDFETKIAGLKQRRFCDKQNREYVFKPAFHKHIPADGFPKFAESIWEKIVTNRDLDLPTQQQLLAQYRCDEIMRVAYEDFSTDIKGYRSQLEAGNVLETLGTEISAHFGKALVAFDHDGSRYNKEVYQKKRDEFIEKMSTVLHVYYVQQLRNLHKKALQKFNDNLAEKLKDDDGEFARKLNEAREEAQSYYSTVAENTKLKDANWSGQDYFAQFRDEIEEIANKRKAEAMERMVKTLEKFVTNSLAEPVEVLLNDSPSDVWPKVINVFNETLSNAQTQLKERLSGFDVSEQQKTASVQDLKLQAWEILQKTIRDEFAEVRVIERLRHKFEDRFRYDDAGLPRVWKPGDDIDGQFSKARDEADSLSLLYSKIDVPLSQLDKDIVEDEVLIFVSMQRFDAASLVVLSPAKLQTLRDKFKREADLLFVEAKRSIVVTTAKIPMWFVVMTVFLGWNEFIAVLSNPIYFLMLIVMACAAYATWYTGMARPAYNVAKVTVREAAKEAGKRLKDKGVDVDNIMDGTLLRNGTVGASAGVKRLQKEFTRSSSSPSAYGRDNDSEGIEMVPPAAGATSVGRTATERRRKGTEGLFDDADE